MDREALEEGDFHRYRDAVLTLHGWASGARGLALLRGALASGVLDAVRTPSTIGEICAATGIGESRARDLGLALQAYGVFEREGDAYRLSEHFGVLASPDAPQSLSALLAKERTIGRALEGADSAEGTYTSLSSEEVLTMAVGIGMRPSSSAARAVGPKAITGMLPEIGRLWEGGARHLELGCGAANALLGFLVANPRLSAVGIEIEGEALAEARRRAEELGVTGRVELRHADARELEEERSFDTAQWSQQYFPADGRQEVLTRAFGALKPGGYLMAPMFGDPPGSVEDLREPAGRSYAVDRLVYGSWGVPVRGVEELKKEIEEVGFEVVRTTSAPSFNPLLVSRGIVLARRPPR